MSLALMGMIDRQFPDAVPRCPADDLASAEVVGTVAPVGPRKPEDGHGVNVKRIRRLMRLMRLMPICQKPSTSKPAKGHKTYAHLLGGPRVDRPSQVWCADLTYLPRRRGFLSLVAVMDWFPRKVLAWRDLEHA